MTSKPWLSSTKRPRRTKIARGATRKRSDERLKQLLRRRKRRNRMKKGTPICPQRREKRKIVKRMLKPRRQKATSFTRLESLKRPSKCMMRP